MTHADVLAAVRSTVENYWRSRAALAFLEPREGLATQRLAFTGIPSIGSMANLLADETVAQAHHSLKAYAASRLAGDVFVALIAILEERLSFRVVQLGGAEGGTFGSLQTKIQQLVLVPSDLREDLNEVRERRNAQMHNGGLADVKYVAAAALANTRCPAYVPNVPLGANVLPVRSLFDLRGGCASPIFDGPLGFTYYQWMAAPNVASRQHLRNRGRRHWVVTAPWCLRLRSRTAGSGAPEELGHLRVQSAVRSQTETVSL